MSKLEIKERVAELRAKVAELTAEIRATHREFAQDGLRGSSFEKEEVARLKAEMEKCYSQMRTLSVLALDAR